MYMMNWVEQVGEMLHEGVKSRHLVLTVPQALRDWFYSNQFYSGCYFSVARHYSSQWAKVSITGLISSIIG